MKTIKNLLFDLGGVFLNIDYPKTVQAFTDLGVKNFDDLYSPSYASHLFEWLETGKIDPPFFYQSLRNKTNISASDDEIKNAWNSMLLYFPLERIEWLDNIKHKYNVYLFSNTNIIHHKCFNEIFKKQTGKSNFENHFIKAYYSYELGLRKPHVASFYKVLEEQNLNAAETLFIDDTLKNIEGGKVVGLQTEYLCAPKTVLDLDL
ncbi:MAG: HAD family hydrolase [Chitinophagaceae bacterium]